MTRTRVPTYLVTALLLGLSPEGQAAEIVASTFLGGAGIDRIEDIARHPDGGLVVAGATGSVDFPTTPGAYQEFPATLDAQLHGFVAKLSADLTQVEWATYLSGSGQDWIRAVGVRSDGAVVVAGDTASPDFPVTDGAYQTDWVGGLTDAFVVELEPDGGALRFSTLLGFSGWEQANALVLDDDGSILVAGLTSSDDFSVPGSAAQAEPGWSETGTNGFVARLRADGGALLASTYLGGHGVASIEAIALGPDGSVHVSGAGRSASFPTTAGAYRETYEHSVEGNPIGFVTRLDARLTTLCHSTWLGRARDVASALTVDSAGRALVGGVGFEPGEGDHDAYLVRVAADGSDLEWARWFGGDAQDWIFDVGLDASCNAHVGGVAYSKRYPFSPNASGDLGLLGDQGVLAAVFDSEGGLLEADLVTGGPNGEHAFAVHVDSTGRFVVAGASVDAAYPTTPGAAQSLSRGEHEAIVTLLSAEIAETESGCGVFEAPPCGEEVIPHGEISAPAGDLMRAGKLTRRLREPVDLRGRERRSPPR